MVWGRATTEGGRTHFVWGSVASEGALIINQTNILTFACFRNALVPAMSPHIFRQLSVKGNLSFFVFPFICKFSFPSPPQQQWPPCVAVPVQTPHTPCCWLLTLLLSLGAGTAQGDGQCPVPSTQAGGHSPSWACCALCPAQHSWAGNCFHVLCFQGQARRKQIYKA